jgi:hypothetical protein
LAFAVQIAGQPQQGLNRLSQAEEFIEKTQERWAEAEGLSYILLLTEEFRHRIATIYAGI